MRKLRGIKGKRAIKAFMKEGNHHIFTKGDVAEIINIQSLKDGKARAYQVKQIRDIILRYKLHQEVNDV